jgi:DNA-binding NtrC family response regulator
VSGATTHEKSTPPFRGLRFQVTVVEGEDAGASLPIDRDVLIGSSEACDLRLRDPSVSRRHLLVRPGAMGVRVVDQESRNGTWCGELRVHDAELAAGSQLRVGDTVLRFDSEVDAAEQRPADKGRTRFGAFLGAAPVLAPMYDVLERVVATDATVLIEGESGTGKELLAEALHDQGPRSGGPFLVLDCGAVPETLIEARLFGHERGAFTGAERAQPGVFEAAGGGTVLLDEVGELPLEMQTRLLRVLDRKEVSRIGAHATIAVDVRIIAATNRDLEREVEEGRFRLDLFHRLAVVLVRVPPLRDRVSDIEPIARELLRSYGGDASALTAEVLGRMRAHRFPGNVRELRNHVERLVVLGDVAPPPRPSGGAEATEGPEDLPYRRARAVAIEQFTRAYVERMLARHGGNVSAAARAAGLARRYFHQLKKESR